MPQTPPRAAAEITIVTTRTTQTVVHFSAAFELPGLDEALPAGDYRVDHDEESIDGASWLAWRGVGSFIHLPAVATPTSTRQMLPINPADLEAALKKDQKLS
jgi:hypothetical protein